MKALSDNIQSLFLSSFQTDGFNTVPVAVPVSQNDHSQSGSYNTGPGHPSNQGQPGPNNSGLLSPPPPQSGRLSSGPQSGRLSAGPQSGRLSAGPQSGRLSAGPQSGRLSAGPQSGGGMHRITG